jgi:hypothetical protein
MEIHRRTYEIRPLKMGDPSMSSSRPAFELTVLNRVSQALAEAKDLKEVKALRDKAEAARQYARSSAMSQEIQNHAAELKLLAERRAGELLDDLVPHGGKRTASSQHGNLTLAELGINANQSSRWRREAAVPEPVFKQYVSAANKFGRDITSQGLLRIGRKLAVRGGAPSVQADGHVGAGRRPGASKKTHAVVKHAPRARDGSPASSTVSGQDSIPELPHELLNELQNHRDLLAKILEPICDRDRATLELSERRLVARLLADIQQLVVRLKKQLQVIEIP